MGELIEGRGLHPGDAEGPLLVLEAPLSLWGGTDPATATISDRHHPQFGAPIDGVVLGIPGSRGSSSSASVLAEAARRGFAPAALLVTRADPILTIGAAVASELYGILIPIVQMHPVELARLRENWSRARVEVFGSLGRVSPR